MPLLIGTIAIVVLFGERLLPQRSARVLPPDFSTHARTLVEQYELEHWRDTLLTRKSGVAEVVIPPRSTAIGETVFPGMITDSGDLVVLAVQRKGEDSVRTRRVLAAGDTLLLRGTWAALDENLDDPAVLVVDQPGAGPPAGRPARPGRKARARRARGDGLVLATGAVPAAVAGLLAAGAIVLLRVLSIDDCYRAISWTTVILVAGMIPLSTAMTQTGAAAKLADELVDVVGDAGPHALLLGLFLLTAILGQLISNMATALIVIPVAISAAATWTCRPSPCSCASRWLPPPRS